MAGSFSPFLTLRRIPPGRAIHAFRQIIDLLAEHENLDIRNVCNIAIKLNFEAFQIGQRLKEKKAAGTKRGKATEIDSHISAGVTAIHNLMLGYSEGIEETDELAPLAKRVLRSAFIAGVGSIVQVPFDIQVSTVEDFLLKFSKGDIEKDIKPGPLHDVVEPLRLGSRLERLARLNRAFDDELKIEESVTQDQWDNASQKAQQALHRVFIKILATYDDDTVEHIAMRSKLIAPILDQNEKLGELYRRSRKVNDINPETGEEDRGPTPEEQPITDGGETIAI